jgi:thiol-disulfide isomerase/thioredoxin
MPLFTYMNYLISFLTFSVCLISCKTETPHSLVSAEIKHSKLKRVYLTDAYEWTVLLDSAEVINDKFDFIIKKNTPDLKLFSISYKDSLGNLHKVEFINRVLSPDSIKFLLDAFICDTSHVKISGDWGSTNEKLCDIQAGNETKALFRTQMMQYGYLDPDNNKRTTLFKEYLDIAKTYPNSFFLLSSLNENKSVLKKGELELLLNQFSSSVLQTKFGKELKDYLKKKTDITSLENLELEELSGIKQKILNVDAKIYMLIIWASWCGPCRQEIPLLKELYKEYAARGVYMTSISIDENTQIWKSVLDLEKMNWNQLIVPFEKMDEFKTKFEIGSIPVVIFVNNQGKVITRTIGVDVNSSQQYRTILNSNLNHYCPAKI